MASIQYVVNAVDSASGVFAKIAASADGLDRQLADLSKRVATPEVDLKDAKFTLGMIRAAERLDKLSAMVADPEVEVDAAKAQTEILRITAMLDRLDGKRVTAHVNVDSGGALGGLLRRLASAGGGAGGLGGIAGTAGGALGIGVAIGPLLVGLAQVTGALAAAGAGVGAFAALAIPQFTAVSKALTQIKTDTLAYNRATTAASRSLALKHIRGDWAALSPVQRGVVRGTQSLQSEFGKLSAKLAPLTFKVFNDGLRIANQLLPDLLPFARAAGTAIDGLLKSLDKFVTPAAGTGLHGKLAAISALPPPTGFQQFLTTLQGLSGPAITALGKGLGQIAAAVGKLIIVAASPDSIRTLSRVLGFLAATINGVSWAINRASGNMQKWVDIAHQTAGKFDEFRHDTARVFAAVATIFDQARHDIASWAHDVAHTFDTLRHSVAVTWNAMWSATIGAQIRSLNAIVGWFRGLPGRVLHALWGLGHSLGSFAAAALTEMWNGFKNVGARILSWLSGFWHNIIGIAKKILGVFSPSSVFYDIGKNMMLGLQGGIADHAHHAVNAARGAVSGALGGDALANQALAKRLFPWNMSQWPAFVSLVMAESGFNRFARNPSSGAYGIPQALPESKLPFAGQAAGGSHAGAQLAWMFNYIAQRYGTPGGAWAHELSAHWYGSGLLGGLFTRPTLIGVGDRPGGEVVDVRPAGSAAGRAGPLVNIQGDLVVQDATDAQLVASRFNWYVTAASLGS